MSVLRNKLKAGFSQIPNDAILDQSLSHASFRILVYLFSRPDGWEINNSDIKNKLNIMQDHTLAKYWKELLVSGWITRDRIRENGKITGGYNYSLIVENPHCGKTLIRENTKLGKNNRHSNTDINTNTDINNNTEFKGNVPDGTPIKTKKEKLTKNGNLIKRMASDFDIAYSYLSGNLEKLQWGADAVEKIRWNGKEIGNISNLRDALQNRMKDKKLQPTDKDTLENWRMFLQMAIGLQDDFLNRNFTPSFLYSQFNSIILKLNQKKNGSNGSKDTTRLISDETKRTVMEELLAEGFFDNGNKH